MISKYILWEILYHISIKYYQFKWYAEEKIYVATKKEIDIGPPKKVWISDKAARHD